ncbi:MAG: HAD family hydrolase [Bacilli bacterium]|nr:HAD family hydrolase [Bacilli bacterium]
MSRKKVSIHFSYLKSINRVLLVSLIVSVLLCGIVALIINGQNKFQDAPLAILVIVNALLVSLPIVLFILCIIFSALFNADLSKKNIAINKLNNFESLLDIDVLCLEKENVIVDGALTIKKVIPLQTVATEQYLGQWLSNMLRATNDKGTVFDALNKKYDFELSAGVTSVLPYDNEIKYSGASFKGGKTIVLGNPEIVPIKNKVGILKRCEEDINKGCRILVVAEGKQPISNDGYHGELDAIALIVLKDHIREGASETFKWFKDNEIGIKVITNDNPLITSVIALEAGIEGADKYISLEGIDNDELDNLVSQYTVFGYATSEQKEMIVNSLKKDQTVMMVGGNSGDILAMKASNFAVATIDADEESQNTADIVLESNSIESLKTAINSSKPFINNLQKILSLALVKTILAFVVVLFFVIFNNNIKQCLFVFNHFLLWDLITNGVAAFLLTLDKNNKRVTPFIKIAIPAAILQVVGVLSIFLLYALQNNNLFSIGLYSIDNIAVVCILATTIFGMVGLYNICYPLNRHRRIAVIVGAALNVLVVAIIMLISYLGVVESSYIEMGAPAYFIAAIIAVLYSALYLFISRIISTFKGDYLEDEN